MTAILTAGHDDRAELARFLGAHVQRVLACAGDHAPGLNAEFFEMAFSAFERASKEAGGQLLVRVSRRVQQEHVVAALADEVAAAAAPGLQEAVREAVEADPAAFVASLVKENTELKSEARHGGMVVEMHNELVALVKDLVADLERSSDPHAQLQPIKALIERAEAARAGVASIPASVSPFRIMATMESVVNSHSEIIMQFGKHIPGAAVARSVRVLSDAIKLLEEIHGPAGTPDQYDDDVDADNSRPMGA
jgi:hypothetical protein